MTLDKLIELEAAYKAFREDITGDPVDHIPSELADRAIEALRELKERANEMVSE